MDRSNARPNPVTQLIHWLGKQPWVSTAARQLVPLDLKVQRKTKGKISLVRLLGLPALVLDTVGRKSGQRRSVPLLYVPHGSEFIVTASNWGQKHHPAWSANLLANPEAEVESRGQRFPVKARLVTGAEREQLWAMINRAWPAYDTYANRAGDREIRLFLLSRESPRS